MRGNVSHKLPSEHEKTKSYHFCCPCSTPFIPQLCKTICHWPLPCPVFFPPLRLHTYDCTEWHCIWELIVQHCLAQAVQKREWLCMDPEPSEVASPDVQFLTNLIVSVTGCRITGVEMQDVKLGWEWLRRCFHHVMDFLLFKSFKFFLFVGYNHASSAS